MTSPKEHFLANNLTGHYAHDPFRNSEALVLSLWANTVSDVAKLDVSFKPVLLGLPEHYASPKCAFDRDRVRPDFRRANNKNVFVYSIMIDMLTARYLAHYKLTLDAKFAHEMDTGRLLLLGVFTPSALPMTFDEWLQDQREEAAFRERLRVLRGEKE